MYSFDGIRIITDKQSLVIVAGYFYFAILAFVACIVIHALINHKQYSLRTLMILSAVVAISTAAFGWLIRG
jgi:hypothetical protein